jgi:hypothetical protein
MKWLIVILILATVMIAGCTQPNTAEEKCKQNVNDKINFLNQKYEPSLTVSLIEVKVFSDKEIAKNYISQWRTSTYPGPILNADSALKDIDSINNTPFYIGLIKSTSNVQSTDATGTNIFFLVCDSEGNSMSSASQLK